MIEKLTIEEAANRLLRNEINMLELVLSQENLRKDFLDTMDQRNNHHPTQQDAAKWLEEYEEKIHNNIN